MVYTNFEQHSKIKGKPAQFEGGSHVWGRV